MLELYLLIMKPWAGIDNTVRKINLCVPFSTTQIKKYYFIRVRITEATSSIIK
jgi:hypothetical protein